MSKFSSLVDMFIAFYITVAEDPYIRYMFNSEKGSSMDILYFSCYISWYPLILDAYETGKNYDLTSFNFFCYKLDDFKVSQSYSSVNETFVK